MKKATIIFSIFSLVTGLSSTSLAQDEDIFGISTKAKNPKSESSIGNMTRNILEKFSLEVSGGAAYHQMGMDFYSPIASQYPISAYQNLENPTFSLSDSLSLSGNNWILPLFNGGLRLNLFNLLTIGGGYGREWGKLGPLRGNDHEFVFEGGSYQISKFYGTAGLIIWDANRRRSFLTWKYRKYSESNLYMQSELRQRGRQIYPWRFVLEGEFGQMKLSNFVSSALTEQNPGYQSRLAVSENPYFGIGIRIERDFSEYAKVFIKGGAEFREFTFASSDFTESQLIKQRVYGLQAGIAMTLPGTKRCKIQGCGVVMKHMHDGIEYRGSSIFNLQNRKVGQWY